MADHWWYEAIRMRKKDKCLSFSEKERRFRKRDRVDDSLDKLFGKTVRIRISWTNIRW